MLPCEAFWERTQRKIAMLKRAVLICSLSSLTLIFIAVFAPETYLYLVPVDPKVASITPKEFVAATIYNTEARQNVRKEALANVTHFSLSLQDIQMLSLGSIKSPLTYWHVGIFLMIVTLKDGSACIVDMPADGSYFKILGQHCQYSLRTDETEHFQKICLERLLGFNQEGGKAMPQR